MQATQSRTWSRHFPNSHKRIHRFSSLSPFFYPPSHTRATEEIRSFIATLVAHTLPSGLHPQRPRLIHNSKKKLRQCLVYSPGFPFACCIWPRCVEQRVSYYVRPPGGGTELFTLLLSFSRAHFHCCILGHDGLQNSVQVVLGQVCSILPIPGCQ